MDRINIRSELLLVFTLLFAITFGAAFFWFYQFATDLIMNRLRQSLMDSASMAASLVTAEENAAVYASGVEGSPEYTAIADKLRLVRGANPLLASVYTMVKSPTNPENELIFVVSADENPETRAHLGEAYDTSGAPEMMLGFNGRAADVEYGMDEFGTWLSGYAPIRDASGQAVAIVGVDMTAEDVVKVQTSVRNISLLGFVVILCCVFVASYLLSNTLTRSLESIAAAAADLEQGQPFDPQRLAGLTHGTDEISQLARVFTRMAVQVQAREQVLKNTVAELRIEIDEAKRAMEVSKITSSEEFQDLKAKARALRAAQQEK